MIAINKRKWSSSCLFAGGGRWSTLIGGRPTSSHRSNHHIGELCTAFNRSWEESKHGIHFCRTGAFARS